MRFPRGLAGALAWEVKREFAKLGGLKPREQYPVREIETACVRGGWQQSRASRKPLQSVWKAPFHYS